jgi:glutamine synthetase
MNKELSENPHRVIAYLGKPCQEFTKADIIRYIQENDIRMVNFMYPAGDGRLKTLNFVINNEAYLDAILTCGERVDGSSLFPFIEAGSSDLYVIPRFRTAFLDPFAEIPTLSNGKLSAVARFSVIEGIIFKSFGFSAIMLADIPSTL